MVAVEVSWKRRSNTLKASGDSNKTLLIRPVKLSDAGEYICEAKSQYETISRIFRLLVIVKYQVTMAIRLNIPFEDDFLNKSSPAYSSFVRLFKARTAQVISVFTDSNSSFVEVTVLFLRKGSVIVDFEVTMSETFSSPQISPPDLRSKVISTMIELASNGSLGNITVGSLVIKEKPPPPNDLKIMDRGTTFLKISWTPPVGQQSYLIENFIISMRGPDSKSTTIVVPANTYSYQVRGLETNARYDFQIWSRSALGDGKPSRMIIATTLTVKPIIANDGNNFTVTENEPIVLVCQGSSDPRPQEVTWLRSNPKATITTNITGNGKILNSYMSLPRATVEDSGTYPCKASHGDETGYGKVHLIVKVPVKVNLNVTLEKLNFTESLKNKSSDQYKKLETRFVTTMEELYRNVTGFKEVIVLGFSHGSVKVQFRVVIVVNVTKSDFQVKQSEAKVDTMNRIIRQVTQNRGELGNGLTVRKESIQSDAPPNRPRNITIESIEEETAHLRWIKPQYADFFSITGYIVKLRKHNEDGWEHKVVVESIQLDSPIKDLEHDTAYYLKVGARNINGLGPDSIQKEFKTKMKPSSSWPKWLWFVVPAAAVLVILLLVCCCCKRRKNINRRNRKQQRTKDISLYSYQSNTFMFSNSNLNTSERITGNDWEIPRESLEIQEKLGSGAFGLVKKGILQTDTGLVTCAVKTLKENASQDDYNDLYQELKFMEGIGRHVNLINLIGCCTIDGPLLVLLEYAKNGSLLDYLHDNATTIDEEHVCSLSDMVKQQISLDIARGMSYLAKARCVHRDLAARNVLLDENRSAKIADFGMSRDVYERGFYEKTTKGKLPVRWMALEAIEKRMFTTQTDVWSYGVVLWEIETGGSVPYSGLSSPGFIDYLKKGNRLHRPLKCSHDMYNIMLVCWQASPSNRPSFDDICCKLQGRETTA